MIDLEAVKEIGRGERFDRLTAMLIGIVAVVASLLVVVQGAQGLAQSRAQAQARRLASDLATRLNNSSIVSEYGVGNQQRAVLVTLEGLSRSQVGIMGGDLADQAIGAAVTNAGVRLQPLAQEMGAPPGPDTPLDDYAAEVLRSSIPTEQLILAIQRASADAGDVASSHGSESVMGLSVVALAGVFTGLAAVVGSSRAGRSLLVLAWICAGASVVLLLISSGLITVPRI